MPNGYPSSRFAPGQQYGPMRYRLKSTDVERWLQQGLGWAGSILMPLGLAVIGLGWYGAAHTGYLFEQLPYLISGGLLGLGLLMVGGFLFFGSWLARVAHQQRQQSELLAATLAQLTAALAARDAEGTRPADRAGETFALSRTTRRPSPSDP